MVNLVFIDPSCHGLYDRDTILTTIIFNTISYYQKRTQKTWLGKPNLYWGAINSMVANYTATKKFRKKWK